VLAGDARLIEKLRREELICSLAAASATRLATVHASHDELIDSLSHLLAGAEAPA
jgi:hypothetical protein